MNKLLQFFRWRALFIALGLIWQLIAVFFLFLTLVYLAEGAGLQLFNFSIVPGSLFIGWIHVMGFFVAAAVSFSIGVGLFGFAKSASPPK